MSNSTPTKVRTRFAPSPTGYVHIGSLRTALFSFLFARKHGGSHVLRIEDTDQTRLVEGAAENLVHVLHTLGVEFDEGFTYDAQTNTLTEQGNFGPYLQSKRLDIYTRYITQLVDAGKAYHCYCSSERLEELRKEQTALKKPPMYDRHCRTLSESEREAAAAACAAEGRQPVIRLAVPEAGQTVIHDLVYGDITYENKTIDDQVLIKSDGFPTYHFAVVVDDHEMQISHVIRGEEWVPSTPKHLLLYEAFGWTPPAFAHLPLILNPDKSKLSKRQGDVAVEDFLNKGYLKEALVNFVAFLGWNPKSEKEIFSMAELITEFDLAKVNKSGAVLDMQKLDWLNGHYIKALPKETLAASLVPYWIAAGELVATADGSYTAPHLGNKVVNTSYLAAIASVEQERLKKLSDIAERTSYFFGELTYNPELLVWKKSTKEETLVNIGILQDWFSATGDETLHNPQALQDALVGFVKENGYDTGSMLWPLRVALTGMQASPGPTEVAPILAHAFGKEFVLDRLAKAKIALQS